MMRCPRFPAQGVSALVALLVLMGACGGDTAPTEASPPAGTTAPTAEPEPEVRTVAIEFREGRVAGGVERVEVAVGEEVEIVVRSDVADHVHVHGYDLFEDVEADGEASIRFTADIPGVFEVELEDAGRQLLTLEVR